MKPISPPACDTLAEILESSFQRGGRRFDRIETLKYAPKIDKKTVGPGTVTAFAKPIIPTFAFIDPYGYKGLSLGL